MDTFTKIDAEKAKQIAIRFLEQYHNINSADAVLQGKTWKISVAISLPKKHIKVAVDSENGKIRCYV